MELRRGLRLVGCWTSSRPGVLTGSGWLSDRIGKCALYCTKRIQMGREPNKKLPISALSKQAVWDWSSDGKYLLVMKNRELWYLAATDREAKPFLQVKGTIRNAQFSPDGKWVAYASNEAGPWQVYVSPFPSANSKWQVSTEGGEEPRWRRDGKELFYLSGGRKLMAVPVKTGNTFEAGPAVSLFQTHARQRTSVQDAFSYD